MANTFCYVQYYTMLHGFHNNHVRQMGTEASVDFYVTSTI